MRHRYRVLTLLLLETITIFDFSAHLLENGTPPRTMLGTHGFSTFAVISLEQHSVTLPLLFACKTQESTMEVQLRPHGWKLLMAFVVWRWLSWENCAIAKTHLREQRLLSYIATLLLLFLQYRPSLPTDAWSLSRSTQLLPVHNCKLPRRSTAVATARASA